MEFLYDRWARPEHDWNTLERLLHGIDLFCIASKFTAVYIKTRQAHQMESQPRSIDTLR